MGGGPARQPSHLRLQIQRPAGQCGLHLLVQVGQIRLQFGQLFPQQGDRIGYCSFWPFVAKGQRLFEIFMYACQTIQAKTLVVRDQR